MSGLLRVRVDVDPVAGPAWQVRVRTGDTPIGSGHTMDTFDLDGRRLPMLPADQPGVAAAVPGPLEALCAGDAVAAAGLLKRLRIRKPGPDDGVTYGRWLFECLLGPVWDEILAVRGTCGVELALHWPITENDLHRLVWEAMRDRHGYFLAGLPMVTVAVTRLVTSPTTKVQTAEGIPRVLFATGRRLADPTIRPGAMYMGLLQAMDLAGLCRARARHGVSVDSLAGVCTTFRPDVVHLVAHGQITVDGRGVLLLDNGHGSEVAADAQTLFHALSAAGRIPTAVALSACNTASAGESAAASDDPTDAGPLAAQLVAAGVPIVSAMSGEISEPACRLYTQRLVDAVHRGASFVEASAHGRRAALINRAGPTSLDWALPALYVAEELDPAVCLIDDEVGDRVGGLGAELGLRENPLFVGRAGILEAADKLVDGDAGVLGILAENGIRGLGATRLLQEIGWRVLRDGHLPLMPGPYATGAGPKAPRELVAEILTAAVLVLRALETDPVPFNVLGPHTVTGDALRTGTPAQVRGRVHDAIDSFRADRTPLNLDSAADLLSEDLTRLCDAAAGAGAPFGPHSKVVLLCNDVHDWAAPSIGAGPTAVGALLRMAGEFGLGTRQRPMPVVLAGSKTEGAGAELRTWAARRKSGYLCYDLMPFDDDDMMLGWQWVLLHPAMGPDRQRYGPSVHTVRPASIEDYRHALYEWVGDHPGLGSRQVYRLPRGNPNYFHTDDDEQAWLAYTQRFPEAVQ